MLLHRRDFVKTTSLALCAGAVAGHALGGEPPKAAVRDGGAYNAPGSGMGIPSDTADRTLLFLDDRFVAQQSGLTRTWHQGRPQPELAITATEPWEKWPHAFGSVSYDPQAKLYRMWYEDIPSRGAVLYAESRDGKRWTKPRVGLFELLGTKANNCVLYPAELPNVFLDPNEKDPESRWKMLAWGGPFGEQKLSGLVLFSSSDGVHWKVRQAIALPDTTDESNQARTVRDTNQVIWDPLGQRYLGTWRTFPRQRGLVGWFRDEKYRMSVAPDGHRRGVGIATAKQLTGPWSPIKTVLKADAKDDEKVRRLSRGAAPDFAELYVMPTFVYGNHYLGILSLLFQVDADAESMAKGTADAHQGGGDLQLTFSHDGQEWFRQPDRQTLIAPSSSKLVPCYAMCSEPLLLGDELWLYYTEADSAHPAAGHRANIRAAVWRKDGFASLDAGAEGGRLTTRPLIVGGKHLELNVAPAKDGVVRVALLDGAGKPLAGYEEAACEPITADKTAERIRWREHPDLAGLRGKAVMAQISLTRTCLYGMRFAGLF